MSVKAAAVRFPVEPRDVDAAHAARRLGITLAVFEAKLPDLLARNFPPADPTTGNFDLDAIDLWRKTRHPRLYGLTPIAAGSVVSPSSMGERFHATKKRGGHDSAP